MNLFSACTFRLKRKRLEGRSFNNLVLFEKKLARSVSHNDEYRNCSRSCLTRGRLFSNANFIESQRKDHLTLNSLYIYILFLIVEVSMSSCVNVVNCEYVSSSTIVCGVSTHPTSLDVTTKGRFLLAASFCAFPLYRS